MAAQVQQGRVTAEAAAKQLVAELSDHEILWTLDGDSTQAAGLLEMSRRYNGTPIAAGRNDRLGIPGIRFADGPRGIVPGSCTAFPVPLARAASWDIELERRIGEAIGAEARAQGANLFAGVCVNVPPFPGWGRSQESYGEDPVLTGAMGAALVEGVRPWVMACLKHFALNSMEEARFTVDVSVSEKTLHEAYLPHFRRGIEAGADAVMSSYNSVNGAPAGQNAHLLTTVLRTLWGFSGFVMTDFVWGLRDPVGSLAAGQDLEMPLRQQRARELPSALRDGRLARADAVRSAERIIGAQLRLAARALPDPDPAVVACPAHRSLAREAAARGAVLLKNSVVDGRPTLPLTLQETDIIAVVGPLADTANLGDHGSSDVRPPSTSSVLQGLRERFGIRVVHVDEPASATATVASAYTAIVVVGLGPEDEGEAIVTSDPDGFSVFGGIFKRRWVGRIAASCMRYLSRGLALGGDRRDLHLSSADVALIEEVAALNKRTVVVVIGGGTIMPDPWDESVAAILYAWYPGMEGGRAIADIVAGDAEPSGRLPMAIPRHRSDLPQVDWHAASVRYPRWFGQQLLDRSQTPAAYPLGFGLGYSSFEIEDVTVESVHDEDIRVSTTLANVGQRAGRHVVQIYACRNAPGVPPTRVLIGFGCAELAAAQRSKIEVAASLRPLQHWTDSGFHLPDGEWTIEASAFAGDSRAARTSVKFGSYER
ncbi:glycoside hydrolase family 3 C-terminal domain-containing protein [Mycobacterium sp. OAE908]